MVYTCTFLILALEGAGALMVERSRQPVEGWEHSDDKQARIAANSLPPSIREYGPE